MNNLTSNSFPVDGVVFAWGMTESGDNYEIPLFEITEKLANSQDSIWLHLNLANSKVQRWLEKTP
jgi:zinc transporter